MTEPGVGTNRYAYSSNDPVNLMDPGGNQTRGGLGAVASAGGYHGYAYAAGSAGIAYGFTRAAREFMNAQDNGLTNGIFVGPPGMEWGNSESGVVVDGNVLSSEINPELNEGKQGKHVPGHKNEDPDRSPIAEGIDPGELVGGAANGDYPQVGTGARGDPVFDFGKIIGTDARSGKQTPYGTVHSGKKGSHVVPANPDRVQEDKTKSDQKQGEEDGSKSNK